MIVEQLPGKHTRPAGAFSDRARTASLRCGGRLHRTTCRSTRAPSRAPCGASAAVLGFWMLNRGRQARKRVLEACVLRPSRLFVAAYCGCLGLGCLRVGFEHESAVVEARADAAAPSIDSESTDLSPASDAMPWADVARLVDRGMFDGLAADQQRPSSDAGAADASPHGRDVGRVDATDGGDGGCPPGEILCQGGCIDPQSDLDHCGRCRNPCARSGACCGGECYGPPGPLPC